MNILNVVQGSPEWLAVRRNYSTASEAPAALGLSKYTSRSELLHQKHTGVEKDVDAFTQGLFDAGHAAEASARLIAEEIVGGDLYPVTAVDEVAGVRLLASLDGVTMDEEIIWEHKLYNADLAAAVSAGSLDPHYTVQMDQQLLVSGAKKCLFMTSDGTRDNMAWCWYEPSQERMDALIAGWKQFAKDLAEYVPAAIEAKPEGRTPETLPALLVEVTGRVTASNLREYRDHALTVFAGINRELTTDQHFADAEKTVKWCGMVEERLAAAKQHALSQTASIDELFRTIDDISAEARRVRLDLDKLVTKRKTEVKDGIIAGGKAAYLVHIAELRKETDGAWIPLMAPDFAGAAKGKRSVASIQDAVDTVLANAKIEADASAKRIRENLTCIKEDGAGYDFLFADKPALICKPLDDLRLVIKTRIAEHKDAEDKRMEAQRARIQEEERVKAEAAVKAVAPAAAPTPTIAPVTQSAPWIASARATPTSAPTLRLGQINERLAPIALTAEGLATLGFKHAATDKAAKLYHESDFDLICAALARHIEAALHKQAA